jgi:hypothetical protein
MLMAAAVTAAAGDAQGACNTIPAAERFYPSERGSVSGPIAAPGEWVTITLPCATAQDPRFDVTNPMNNVVTLRFESPPPLSGTAIFPQLPGEGPIEVQVESSTALRFRVPNTMTSRPRFGLSGPARVTVTTGGLKVAEIAKLYQPSDGCARVDDDVFKTFTILPRPNDVQALLDPSSVPLPERQPLLMTVDGGGNLLIPLDHTRWLPNTAGSQSAGVPVAIFQQGEGKFPAFEKPPIRSIADALAAAPEPDTLVRAFTLDGRPLPPLLRVDAKGYLFGTADTARSVLRIQRLDRDGHVLYDVLGRLTTPPGSGAGTGPMVAKNPRAQDFRIGKCDPVPLTGLRSSELALAYARDESLSAEGNLNQDQDAADLIAQLQDPKTAGHFCRPSTRKAMAEVTTGGITRPMLEVEGSIVAFIESEAKQRKDYNRDGDMDDNFLRVMSAQGTDLTGGDIEIEVRPPLVLNGRQLANDPDTVVNGNAFVISGDLVFYRAPVNSLAPGNPPTLQVLATAPTRQVYDLGIGACAAAVVDQRALVLSPESPGAGCQSGVRRVAYLYDGSSDPASTPSPLNVVANRIALSDFLLAVTVPEAVDSTYSNNDGDRADDVLAVREIKATPGTKPASLQTSADDVGITGWTVAFITREASEGAVGTDLNGDKDVKDRVLRVYGYGSVVPPAVTAPPGQAAAEFVVARDLVAFRTPEADQSNTILNGDNDSDDEVMQAYDLATATLMNTGQAALVQDEPGLEWMRPYAIRGRTVFFLTREQDQDRDLTGNGNLLDTVLQTVNLASQTAQVLTASVGPSAALSVTLQDRFDGPVYPRPDVVAGSDVWNEALLGRAALASHDPSRFPSGVFFRTGAAGVERTLHILETRPPAPPAFLQSYGNHTILRVRSECDTGSRDGSFLVVGDHDEDGTLDPFDLCVNDPDPEQSDDNLDGLGDRHRVSDRDRSGDRREPSYQGCGTSYCTPFVPPSPPVRSKSARRAQGAIAKAALRYLRARGEATRGCLDALAAGDIRATHAVGVATTLCRGSFIGGVEIAPNGLKKTAKALSCAGSRLMRAIERPCWVSTEDLLQGTGETPEALARRVLQAYAESVNAVTHVAYGNVVTVGTEGEMRRLAQQCQKAVGKASLGFLESAVAAAQSCLDRHPPESSEEGVVSLCLGYIGDSGLVPPTDGRAATQIEEAKRDLGHAVDDPACRQTLGGLDACGEDGESAKACMACTAWRRAVEAVRSVYGPRLPGLGPVLASPAPTCQ